jgi:hypothetical protein
MNPKPSLYATLPVGTIVEVSTGWVNTSNVSYPVHRVGEVLEDKGEYVSLLITTDGYGRPAQIKQSFLKYRIIEIIRGPIA